jgi:hypothetical protein
LSSFIIGIGIRIYISKLQNNPYTYINEKHVLAINILRNVHFIVLNLVIMDGSFYSSRIITHIKYQDEMTVSKVTADSQKMNVIVAYLMLMFLMFDLLIIYLNGNSLRKAHNPYHLEDQKDHSESI